MTDAPEKIGRFDYGRGDIRYTSPPLFITGQTNYIRADLVDDAVKALSDVLRWAEARCPCHHEEPNPCPLCGASVENLEPCKSAENTLPRDLLGKLRRAAALTRIKGDVT